MNPWLMLGGLGSIVAAALGAAYLTHRYDVGQETIAVAKVEARAITTVQHQGAINTQIATTAQAEHDRIVYRTQTLIKQVPEYVTVQADTGCVVPRGFVELLNNASDGVSAAPASPPESADAPSGVKLDTVAASVVENYGVANSNAAQLKALQDWAQQSGLMAP